ncbi:hypothetical protein KC363_g112 [Hortaea werneckii]|nr:hypothetical protein KC363_g112 [Hortaea werneckii]
MALMKPCSVRYSSPVCSSLMACCMKEPRLGCDMLGSSSTPRRLSLTRSEGGWWMGWSSISRRRRQYYTEIPHGGTLPRSPSYIQHCTAPLPLASSWEACRVPRPSLGASFDTAAAEHHLYLLAPSSASSETSCLSHSVDVFCGSSEVHTVPCTSAG